MTKKEQTIRSTLFLSMQEMGLEPTRSHLRQILSLMRLPFRHSCSTTNDIIAHPLFASQSLSIHFHIKMRWSY